MSTKHSGGSSARPAAATSWSSGPPAATATTSTSFRASAASTPWRRCSSTSARRLTIARVLAIIRQAEGLWLAGGDQSRYVKYWKDTPVGAALDAHVRAGKPLGGTSAGLAVLGEFSYSALDPGTLTSPIALQVIPSIGESRSNATFFTSNGCAASSPTRTSPSAADSAARSSSWRG
jgi:cyanophycinase-like exopeptidase